MILARDLQNGQFWVPILLHLEAQEKQIISWPQGSILASDGASKHTQQVSGSSDCDLLKLTTWSLVEVNFGKFLSLLYKSTSAQCFLDGSKGENIMTFSLPLTEQWMSPKRLKYISIIWCCFLLNTNAKLSASSDKSNEVLGELDIISCGSWLTKPRMTATLVTSMIKTSSMDTGRLEKEIPLLGRRNPLFLCTVSSSVHPNYKSTRSDQWSPCDWLCLRH